MKKKEKNTAVKSEPGPSTKRRKKGEQMMMKKRAVDEIKIPASRPSRTQCQKEDREEEGEEEEDGR